MKHRHTLIDRIKGKRNSKNPSSYSSCALAKYCANRCFSCAEKLPEWTKKSFNRVRHIITVDLMASIKSVAVVNSAALCFISYSSIAAEVTALNGDRCERIATSRATLVAGPFVDFASFSGHGVHFGYHRVVVQYHNKSLKQRMRWLIIDIVEDH